MARVGDTDTLDTGTLDTGTLDTGTRTGTDTDAGEARGAGVVDPGTVDVGESELRQFGVADADRPNPNPGTYTIQSPPGHQYTRTPEPLPGTNDPPPF